MCENHRHLGGTDETLPVETTGTANSIEIGQEDTKWTGKLWRALNFIKELLFRSL